MSPGLPHSTRPGAASEAADSDRPFRELEVVYALAPRPELGIARGEADFTADQIGRTPPT